MDLEAHKSIRQIICKETALKPIHDSQILKTCNMWKSNMWKLQPHILTID